MAAQNLDSDLDFAFQIQMQEAVAASLALRPMGSQSDAHDDDVLGQSETLLPRDMKSNLVVRKEREEFDRRVQDRRLGNGIVDLPLEYWCQHGIWYEKPYDSYGASPSSSSQSLVDQSVAWRLYFKGLVEWVSDSDMVVAGAGIAIFDSKRNLVFHSGKNLEAFHGGEVISGEAAELEALVEGLNQALASGFNSITFFCNDNTIFDCVTQILPPKNGKVAELVNQVAILRRKFTYCNPSFAAPDDIEFAFKCAREAIVSQITRLEEAGKGKSLKETCTICLEDTDVAQMFLIDSCLHRYCFSCMKQHVEAKLLNGQIARCPHDGCNSEMSIDSCAKFLPPNLVEIMSQRIKESSIPATQKVYCPDPKCSALMSKDEVLEYTKASSSGAEQSGARKCMKCQKIFCINCKVPWHCTMTCNDYRRENPHGNKDERLLKSLAMKKLWRQCAKCNLMVELLEGCYHITCRSFIFL
ncbi:hypothetical protein TIFTF001_000634 [Ficus carica]|uniref:RBR-type E3 ubiquitin transferase n=1 Tax=Ficus carica TaxID=3494 RepID=A0AA87Z5C3_FICCA|nr:hypothetical protein TIFTF001_000634 [Ficus carica]